MVKTAAPLDGRSAFTGTIAGVADGAVELDVDGIAFRIPVSDIKRAHLKGAVDFSS